jgi:hypothetical protein
MLLHDNKNHFFAPKFFRAKFLTLTKWSGDFLTGVELLDEALELEADDDVEPKVKQSRA